MQRNFSAGTVNAMNIPKGSSSQLNKPAVSARGFSCAARSGDDVHVANSTALILSHFRREKINKKKSSLGTRHNTNIILENMSQIFGVYSGIFFLCFFGGGFPLLERLES